MKDLPSNMKIKVKFIKKVQGKKDSFLWEVNGVVIEGKNNMEAQEKYSRTRS